MTRKTQDSAPDRQRTRGHSPSKSAMCAASRHLLRAPWTARSAGSPPRCSRGSLAAAAPPPTSSASRRPPAPQPSRRGRSHGAAPTRAALPRSAMTAATTLRTAKCPDARHRPTPPRDVTTPTVPMRSQRTPLSPRHRYLAIRAAGAMPPRRSPMTGRSAHPPRQTPLVAAAAPARRTTPRARPPPQPAATAAPAPIRLQPAPPPLLRRRPAAPPADGADPGALPRR